MFKISLRKLKIDREEKALKNYATFEHLNDIGSYV